MKKTFHRFMLVWWAVLGLWNAEDAVENAYRHNTWWMVWSVLLTLFCVRQYLLAQRELRKEVNHQRPRT